MNTKHPTVEIFFVFAQTYCRVRVYETEFDFARKLLECTPGVEIHYHPERGGEEVDTRLLFHLVSQAFPPMLQKVIPAKEYLIEKAKANFLVKSG